MFNLYKNWIVASYCVETMQLHIYQEYEKLYKQISATKWLNILYKMLNYSDKFCWDDLLI